MKTDFIPHSKPTLGEEEIVACQKVLKSHYLAKGPETKAFSEALQQKFQRKYAILTSSGYAALHLAIIALSQNKKQNIFLPSYVCTALLNAVHISNTTPLLTDTPKQGICMDPKGTFLNQETKGIILYPQMFGLIQKLNFPKHMHIIEDCAMSLGKNAMQQGDISITSFYATKMMTCGQGGAILTDREDLYLEIRDLMSYDNQNHYRPRFNYDPSDLSSAIGKQQLQKLDTFSEKRTELCHHYDSQLLKKCPTLIAHPKGLSELCSGDALFRYWICVPSTKDYIETLLQRGIEAKSPVYKPLHQYLKLKDSDFPYATQAQENILSLPFYPSLSLKEVEYICDQLAMINDKN